MSLTVWQRLVRFLDADGKELYGEPPSDLAAEKIVEGIEVTVFEGENVLKLHPTGRKAKVAKLLGPVRSQDVPVVRCIGLNYRTHILETGHPLPENPTVFIKAAPTVADHGSPVHIPKIAQNKLDYEGELTILIGKDCKDVLAAQALDVIAGYTCGNDVSARDWQIEPSKAGPRPQWCFGKGFDQFAPLGPVLVSPSLVGDLSDAELTTLVNGEERQRGEIGDLVFGVKALVAFCSQGQTLQAGSLIMTGTPGGVGAFMKPQMFLKDGDVVKVSITGLGTLINTMHFAS